jgi:mevalonate kinase
MNAFETATYGKWILAGEHAVLRGCPALAFPLTSKSLRLQYRPGTQPLSVDFEGPSGADLKLLFYGVLENALARLHVNEPLKGHFRLENDLPVGAGLGASAALCGAVARWCEAQGWIDADDVYEFACRLEDLFHGESSGVDLAVSLSAQGIRFVRQGQRRTISPLWWPKLYLSYCGQRGMTSECVNKVKALFVGDEHLAQHLDEQMRHAVDVAERALASPRAEGLPMLEEAFRLSRDCFRRWGLCQGDLGAHMDRLEQAGARAVKPTGSGGGGYVLSLWDREPPPSLSGIVVIPQPNL